MTAEYIWRRLGDSQLLVAWEDLAARMTTIDRSDRKAEGWQAGV
jgi:hypothetical protein